MNRIIINKIQMSYTNEARTIRIYLPDSYSENPEKRYPVLYMHDGQNLFDDKYAFGGCSWNVIPSAQNLVKKNVVREFIIVGIDNNANRRFEDYSPWKNTVDNPYLPLLSHGGDGDLYADFLVNELLPYINSNYRTLSDRKNTAIAGSSMGGLISAYIIAKYPDIFSKAGIFSPACWFAEKEFLAYIKYSDLMPDSKFYIEVGTEEQIYPETPELAQAFISSTLNYYRALQDKGMTIQQSRLQVAYKEPHSESAWRKFIPEFFEFIFGTSEI